MKTTILAFMDTLKLFDYLLFGGILFFFLFFLILAILFHNRLTLALSLIIAAFIILVTAPLQYMLLHKYLYKHTITLTTVQDLEFTDALLVRGDLNNTSQQTINECSVYVSISKVSPFKIINNIYVYVPFKTQVLHFKTPLKPKESYNFKMLIEPFRYQKHFQVIARGQCK
ncbi:MAG: DUF2393 family protein [Sulfuricurvum sp.]|uniref:DUF2393 family protein n=1 Tax=Sulfuricurvum sp. TaxID=2025608 RepID=UPI0026044FD6|nr:DUF2393 family protein [Sulfuricurvum sp.]MDD2828182.1 DUF2393 family protein [Sulfuricurvum sp.]MDD4949863.1 DUF2393 family protein [Sulfuricurvum sp.]